MNCEQINVGNRGYVGKSLCEALESIGMIGLVKRKALRSMAGVAKKASIFSRSNCRKHRNDKENHEKNNKTPTCLNNGRGEKTWSLVIYHSKDVMNGEENFLLAGVLITYSRT